MNTLYRIQNRDREKGITLIEILVVMVILGVFMALVGRSFLPQIFRSQDTVAQDKVKIVYEQLQACGTANDGRVGSFGMITDANCVDGIKVENKVRIAKLGGPSSASNQTNSDGSCWDSRLATGSQKSGADADVRGLWITPDTTTKEGSQEANDNNDANQDDDFNESESVVFICTYKAEQPDRAGQSVQQDHADSTYFRISVTSNNTTYFFARTPQGNQNCSIRTSDGLGTIENKSTNKLRCR